MIQREFLGWDGVMLPRVVDWLLRQVEGEGDLLGGEGDLVGGSGGSGGSGGGGGGGVCDLSSWVVVLPGSGAKRRLMSLLAERVGAYLPPRVVTVGELPEVLVDQGAVLKRLADKWGGETVRRASDLERRLVMAEVLRGMVGESVAVDGVEVERLGLADVFTALPKQDDVAGWLRLAGEVTGVMDDLAAGRHSLAGVATLMVEEYDEAGQGERWAVLSEVESRYAAAMRERGWVDRNGLRETGLAMFADEQQTQVLNADVKRVALVSCIDLSPLAVEIVQAFAASTSEADCSIHPLIYAAEAERDWFDDLGVLRREPVSDAEVLDLWSGYLPMTHDELGVVDDVWALGDGVIDSLKRDESERACVAEDVVIGVGDAGLVPGLKRSLAGVELAADGGEVEEDELVAVDRLVARYAGGEPVLGTGVCVMLRLWGEVLSTGRLDAFAAMLRQVDVAAWLTREQAAKGDGGSVAFDASIDLVRLLDGYATAHLQGVLGEEWLGEPEQVEGLRWAMDQVRGLGLMESKSQGAMDFETAADVVRRGLMAVYGGRALSRYVAGDRAVLAVLEMVGRGLDDLVGAFEAMGLQEKDGGWLAGEVIGLVLGELKGKRVPEFGGGNDAVAALQERNNDKGVTSGGGRGVVEVVDWIELLLDDRGEVLLVGMNEGRVPTGGGVSDAFLPDGLRRRLGLADAQQRLHRDAFILATVLHSRQRVRLLAARRGEDGEPLVPSRLLLACGDKALVGRVRSFFEEGEVVVRGSDEDGEALAFREVTGDREWEMEDDGNFWPGAVLPAADQVAVDRLFERFPVTGFKVYLDCPYRFYLRYVKRLDAVGGMDASGVASGVASGGGEMDGGAFGSLVHGVLHAFGSGDLVGATDERAVVEQLEDLLAEGMRAQFGQAQRVVLRLQAQQARERLQRFAAWQVATVREGWRVLPDWLERNGELRLGGAVIRGRIDRVDVHADGRVRVVDYKTGDTAGKPGPEHYGRRQGVEQWLDLQLPIYAAMLQGAGLVDEQFANVEVGYMRLPRKLSDSGYVAADWDGVKLAEGVAEAVAVLERIRAGVFWPPREPSRWGDAMSPLCLEGVFGRDRLLEQAGSVQAVNKAGGVR